MVQLTGGEGGGGGKREQGTTGGEVQYEETCLVLKK